MSDGLEFSGYVKQLRPDLPVIWGGWHATFAAGQAMEDPRVDVVARGMGERTFVDMRVQSKNGPLRDIPGIHFRDGEGIKSTPDRPLEDINNFPPPAYELIARNATWRKLPTDIGWRARFSVAAVLMPATSASIRATNGSVCRSIE